MRAADDPATISGESPAPRPVERAVDRTGFRPRLPATAIVWLLTIAGFAVFLVAGSLTIGAGPLEGEATGVLAEWWRFLDDLPSVGRPMLLRATVVAALLVALVGSGVGLWLALTAGGGSEPGSHPDQDAA
jgi:hypothetical protein